MQIDKNGRLINIPVYRIRGKLRKKLKKMIAGYEKSIKLLDSGVHYTKIYRFNKAGEANIGALRSELLHKIADIKMDLSLKFV